MLIFSHKACVCTACLGIIVKLIIMLYDTCHMWQHNRMNLVKSIRKLQKLH